MVFILSHIGLGNQEFDICNRAVCINLIRRIADRVVGGSCVTARYVVGRAHIVRVGAGDILERYSAFFTANDSLSAVIANRRVQDVHVEGRTRVCVIAVSIVICGGTVDVLVENSHVGGVVGVRAVTGGEQAVPDAIIDLTVTRWARLCTGIRGEIFNLYVNEWHSLPVRDDLLRGRTYVSCLLLNIVRTIDRHRPKEDEEQKRNVRVDIKRSIS